MSARNELENIVRDPINSPMRIIGAAISFLRMQASTNFERELAGKLDQMMVTEIKAAQAAAISQDKRHD